MKMREKSPNDYKRAIQASLKDIYSPIEIGDPDYYIPTRHLEALLNEGLQEHSFAGLPNRTRSKAVKTAVCTALGYPVPKSFRRTKPRFFGQHLDTYSLKATNLQIYNEELSPARRYALIQVLSNGGAGRVRVLNGQELALLDTTGTITRKYQARLERRDEIHELVSPLDTDAMQPHVRVDAEFKGSVSAVSEPVSGELFAIGAMFKRLSPLVGRSFPDPGVDQERNRGAALHRLVCERLSYHRYEDKGQFPDVRHQLLEVKLQTSPTIDLGLVFPNSHDLLDIRQLGSHHPRHCDARYAMFYAVTDGTRVTLTHLFLTTGADFFERFRRFEGNVTNEKIQIPLGRGFFSA